MKFGAHVSIAGGVTNAPANAHSIGCETFQFFSRSPRGGQPPALTQNVVKAFKQQNAEFGLRNYYIHTPYYINFASTNSRIAKGSIEVVREELERGDKLGVRATMTHLGSSKDIDEKDIIPVVSQALIAMLKGYKGKNQFLIEIAAGAGRIIGSSFTEIASIIKVIEKKVNHHIGVCFDTCHAFASGYDLRTKEAVDKTFKEFDQTIGLERLVMVHGNDSKTELGDRKDRHENIGQGKIGKAGFKAIVNHPKLKHLDFIAETPWTLGEATIKKDLQILKSLRTKH